MDRLSRFTIPGIAFVVSLCYFIYSLSRSNILSSFNDNLLTLIAGVLSTPVIGLIVTSTLHGIIHCFKHNGRPGPYWLYLPKNLNPLLLKVLGNGDEPKTKDEWKKFYWKYQQKFRAEAACEKVIDFTAHRWTYYFVLINSAFAIFFAMLLSLIFVLCTSTFDPIVKLVVPGLVTAMSFGILAFWLSKFSLNDAREVEHLDVIEKIANQNKQR